MFAGALVGFAFLAKMLQAFLVLPALATAYALFAGIGWRRRIGHLLAAFAATGGVFMLPTPTEVPQRITSPGSRVMSFEIMLTSCATLKRMSLTG